MHRTALLLLFILIAAAFRAVAQEGPVYESGGELIPEQAAYNVHYYDLRLRIDPSDSTIAGKVAIHAVMEHPAREIVIDLDPRFTLEEIVLEGEEAPVVTRSQTSKRIRIRFDRTWHQGEKFRLEVAYSGRPVTAANPPWDGGFVWERTPSGEPWIGVAVQGSGAWTWWPNKDHPGDKPDSVSVRLTLPDGLLAASNGRLRGISVEKEGWTTWHWHSSQPISTYNVTVNAAPYEIITGRYRSVTGRKIELIFWVLPEERDRAERLFKQIPGQLRFLEDLLGPYPFRSEKFGVAHAPYLGMEHQTVIAYGAGFVNDRLFGAGIGFDDLLQHELSHEWWGNMVSVPDWRHFWIHESFATYMQALYAEHLAGEEGYHRMMRIFRQQIVSREVLVPDTPATSREILSGGRSADLYYKGAWFLHTLRYYLGEERFFKLLRRFAYPEERLERVTDGTQVRFATTEDLLRLAGRIGGEDLDRIFELYLHRAGLPILTAEREEEQLCLSWQAPDGGTVPLPVEVEIAGERQRFLPETDGSCLPAPRDAEVLIDPDSWLLMELEGPS